MHISEDKALDQSEDGTNGKQAMNSHNYVLGGTVLVGICVLRKIYLNYCTRKESTVLVVVHLPKCASQSLPWI